MDAEHDSNDNGDVVDDEHGMDDREDDVLTQEDISGSPATDPRIKSVANLILRSGGLTKEDFEACPEVSFVGWMR